METVTVPSPTADSSIVGTARRVGGWSWAESRLYEIVGGWAATTASGPDEASHKVYFDVCSRHHAWRAELLTQRLPGRLVQAYPGEGTPQPPADLVGPAPSAERALAVLEATDDPVARLALYARIVLPRVMVAYRAWRRACSPASGRSLHRVLGLILADITCDWEEGCDLLARTPMAAGGAELVAASTSRLDAVLDTEPGAYGR
jgi:hypothetical protein